MKKSAALLALLFLIIMSKAQQPSKNDDFKTYRQTATKINDLVHTKLDAHFDYSHSYLNGKVWITLKPHFYPTDSLSLDAKGMDIKEVAIVKNGRNIPLKHQYDGMILDIALDKTYHNNEQYTIYIDYTAKPDEYTGKGSAAITDAKGLYFINPRGEEKDKPTQIWTQGETEATSVWVPTIDKPNQKTTDEIIMTVPAKYVTLSNGKLVGQKTNADGTRTDDWKMELPHSPYLFFMGVGDYAIIKDKYKDKEVSYYVEKPYASVARKIFGNTPEMIAFYSRITGVDYPWAKYSQIVGRDYVSGAMENTTATLHQESAQQDARQLTDGNSWESVIAHELFHQWFGDLVTTESWSNLTLNESFANYSEFLWNEYKYGKDAAYAHNFDDMQGYLNSGSENKDLVRFHYNDKEDMFDAVSYNKGGRILNMLRNYVGDSAFFKSLNLYLTTNKFKSAEAQNLRLAFEEVTGRDLNWYWNQWYYGSGHPKLTINYNYNDTTHQARLIVEQTQSSGKVFILPVKVDVWNGNSKKQYSVWIEDKIDTLYFPSSQKPELVNFDADKLLLAQKSENKTLTEYLFQYNHAFNYVDRREAVDAALKNQNDAVAWEIISKAMKDPFAGLRSYTISRIDLSKDRVKSNASSTLFDLAQHDKSRPVKAAAIAKLGDYKDPAYNSFYMGAIKDSSYSVSGSALDALGKIDSVAAFNEAKRLSVMPAKGKLSTSITKTLIKYGDESAANVIYKNFEDMPLSQGKFDQLQALSQFLMKVNSFETFKRGVDDIIGFEMEIPESFRGQVSPFINGLLKNVQKAKENKGQKEMVDYISSKIPKDDKKGF